MFCFHLCFHSYDRSWRHDGLPCTVFLSLGLRLFPGESVFNHTSRLDNHNRQRHSHWGPVTWPCLISFGGVTGWKRSLEHSGVLAVKVIDREGAGHVPLFSIHIWLLLGSNFGHWGNFGSLRDSCPPNLQYEFLANFYWTLLPSLPTIFFLHQRHCPSTCEIKILTPFPWAP